MMIKYIFTLFLFTTTSVAVYANDSIQVTQLDDDTYVIQKQVDEFQHYSLPNFGYQKVANLEELQIIEHYSSFLEMKNHYADFMEGVKTFLSPQYAHHIIFILSINRDGHIGNVAIRCHKDLPPISKLQLTKLNALIKKLSFPPIQKGYDKISPNAYYRFTLFLPREIKRYLH